MRRFFPLFSSCGDFRRVARGCAVLVILFAALPAHAEDQYEMGAKETFVYDTNPLMVRNGAEQIYGSETRAFIGYVHETGSSLAKADVAVARSQLSDSDYNSNDFYLTAQGRRMTARWLGEAKAGATVDTNRSSDFSTSQLSVSALRRYTWNFDPSLVYSLSERTRLSLSGSVVERQYEDRTLTDYRTWSVSPSVLYNVSPVQVVSLSVRGRRYTSLDTSQRVDSVGPYLGWQYQFKPEYSIGLFAGYIGSKYHDFASTGTGWDYSPVYSAEFKYEGEKNKASLAVSQQRQPNADGTDSSYLSVSAKDAVKISPVMQADLGASFFLADQSPSSGSDLDQAWDARAGVTYNVSDRWSLSLSQSYRYEDYINTDSTADRYVTRFSLTYDYTR